MVFEWIHPSRLPVRRTGMISSAASTRNLVDQRQLAVRAGASDRKRSRDRAFTLVELLVSVAVIGAMMSLLLAAVQASRDAARKASCANNLRNHVLALQEFVAAYQRLPAGREYSKTREYSWCVELLPYLEQKSLYDRFDRTKPWTDPAVNQTIADQDLRIFRCLSAIKKFPGKTDYGGIQGSSITVSKRFDFNNGVMLEVGRRRRNYLTPAQITDGLSQTLAIAECTDRDADAGGRWISGYNCFSHNNGPVNGHVSADIFSRHAGGALVGFVDGKVHFLSQNTDGYVVGALCTRNGGETVNEF